MKVTTEKFADVYPSEPEGELAGIVDFGLVSISHWGCFDIAPFGAMITRANEVEWQRNGKTISTIQCDTDEFQRFVRPIHV